MIVPFANNSQIAAALAQYKVGDTVILLTDKKIGSNHYHGIITAGTEMMVDKVEIASSAHVPPDIPLNEVDRYVANSDRYVFRYKLKPSKQVDDTAAYIDTEAYVLCNSTEIENAETEIKDWNSCRRAKEKSASKAMLKYVGKIILIALSCLLLPLPSMLLFSTPPNVGEVVISAYLIFLLSALIFVIVFTYLSTSNRLSCGFIKRKKGK